MRNNFLLLILSSALANTAFGELPNDAFTRNCLIEFVESGGAKVPCIRAGAEELIFEDAPEISYIELDISNNGNKSIVIEPLGKNKYSSTKLYQRDPNDQSGVKLLGNISIDINRIRIGTRDGHRGYYEYKANKGGDSGTLSFCAFDDHNTIVPIWEKVAFPIGEDKDFFEAVFKSSQFSKPEIHTVTIDEIRNAEKSNLHLGQTRPIRRPANASDVENSENTSSNGDQSLNVNGLHKSHQKRWLFYVLAMVAVILFCILVRRTYGNRK